MMGSFNVTPHQAKKAIREYLSRRREFKPPVIDLKKEPEPVLMPEFQRHISTHAPMNSEVTNAGQ